MHAALIGLVTGLTLIVAIGAQNAFVLRQGLLRRHVGAVVAVCAVSDLVLICAGVAGLGAVVEAAPGLIDVVRWAGVAFLTWYGLRTLWAARHSQALEAGEVPADTGRRAAVGTAAALTWLNPHVYLDTVLLLGSVAAQQGSPGRWWFAVGASLASLLWFAGLGYGARFLRPFFASPRAWQGLDVVVGLTMLVIAAVLALG